MQIEIEKTADAAAKALEELFAETYRAVLGFLYLDRQRRVSLPASHIVVLQGPGIAEQCGQLRAAEAAIKEAARRFAVQPYDPERDGTGRNADLVHTIQQTARSLAQPRVLSYSAGAIRVESHGFSDDTPQARLSRRLQQHALMAMGIVGEG